jgi:hypothetical protein
LAFLIKTLYMFLPSPICATFPPPPRSTLFDQPNNVWWWVQIMKLHIVHLSPFSYYLIPLRSKYSPQHPVLKHPLALRQCTNL